MSIETIAQNLPALFAALLVSILFIQSGLDKIFDRRGNLEWLTGHFSKTFLAPLVPILLVTITVMELAAGVLCATGIVYFLITSSTVLIFVASVIAAFSIIALFCGQRIAKDYAGAAILIPYFILVAILMYLTSPFSKAS
ncbi:MAG: DoxX family protein [Pyrinomonadaceae bacterium]